MAEQYFSAEPSSKDLRRTLNVTLQGHDAQVQVSNGVFSGSRVDLGTSVLLKHAPEPPVSGNVLDLGCGWGPIALALAFASPEANVWAVDVNERALELTHVNAEANGCRNIHTTQVDETSTPLPADRQSAHCEPIPGDLTFDAIWSNPRFASARRPYYAAHGLAAQTQGGGAAYLVVQKNLGSDSLIPWLDESLGEGFTASKYASSKGFRIIEVRHEI